MVLKQNLRITAVREFLTLIKSGQKNLNHGPIDSGLAPRTTMVDKFLECALLMILEGQK